MLGGSDVHEGNVMVNVNGKYGPICDDHWDLAEVSNCWMKLKCNL